jgi:DNA-binding transcriptional LysR family regulator
MDRITAARVFVEVIEQGSFSAAAEKLGMSRAMATRYLAELESWTGTRLIQRSTRKLSLTSAGEACLSRCRQLQEIAEEIESDTGSSVSAPRGKIRITASVSLAQTVLSEVIARFVGQFPQTSVDLITADRTMDLIESGMDLAIRISSELEPSLIAKKLGVCRSVICASPEYLKKFGTPKKIEDLSRHNCLAHSYVAKTKWHFTRGTEEASVPVSGNMSSNETTVLLKGVLSHMGIAMLPVYLVHKEIAEAKVLSLVEDWRAMDLGIYAVYVSKKYTPPAVRAFIDFLALEMQKAIT